MGVPRWFLELAILVSPGIMMSVVWPLAILFWSVVLATAGPISYFLQPLTAGEATFILGANIVGWYLIAWVIVRVVYQLYIVPRRLVN